MDKVEPNDRARDVSPSLGFVAFAKDGGGVMGYNYSYDDTFSLASFADEIRKTFNASTEADRNGRCGGKTALEWLREACTMSEALVSHVESAISTRERKVG